MIVERLAVADLATQIEVLRGSSGSSHGREAIERAAAILELLRTAPTAATDSPTPAGRWQAVRELAGDGGCEVLCSTTDEGHPEVLYGRWQQAELTFLELALGDSCWIVRRDGRGATWSSPETLGGPQDARVDRFVERARAELERWDVGRPASGRTCSHCGWNDSSHATDGPSACVACGASAPVASAPNREPSSAPPTSPGAGPLDTTRRIAPVARGPRAVMTTGKPPADDRLRYDVVLRASPATERQAILRVVYNARWRAGEVPLDLAHAEQLVDGAPSTIRRRASREQAEVLRDELTALGAEVEVRRAKDR